MESRVPCACRDGVAHTAARGPSCLAIDLPNLLSPKASLQRSPPLACTALPAPRALERCSQGGAKRPFIFLIRTGQTGAHSRGSDGSVCHCECGHFSCTEGTCIAGTRLG